MTSPKVLDYELLICKAYKDIIDRVKVMRFKSGTTIEQDEAKLSTSTDYREKTALQFRITNKRIAKQQSIYIRVLIEILTRLKEKGLAGYKESYLPLVEGVETEREVLGNRLALSNYLKEFYMNWSR